VDPREGAVIEITLTHTVEGEPHQFQVRRSWSVREKHVRDRLEVIKDGALDQMLTDAWAEQIEEMIPVRLSKFFFFDGEKIEALADAERSSEALSTGIHVLLGLDIVDQLTADLVVLERRKKTEQKSAPDREAIEAAKQAADKLAEQKEDLVGKRTAAQAALYRAERALRDAEERFKLGGGEAFERRREIEVQQKAPTATSR
jgi:DNA sulfur modification protein DndD